MDAFWQSLLKLVHGAPYGDKCRYCGTEHPPQQYPVWRKKCGECGKDNHFKVVCRSLWMQQVSWQPKMLIEVQQ